MRVRVSSKEFAALKADLAVCFAREGDRQPRGVSDAGLRRDLAREMRAEGFRGRVGDQLVWNANGRYASRRFLVVGLGSADDDSAIRSGCARAARAAQEFAARRLALRLPDPPKERIAEQARAATEGALLGAYRFERYITDEARRTAQLTTLEVSHDGSPQAVRKAVARAQTGAGAVCLARDLVNEPPSRFNPTAAARIAVRAAKAAGLRSKVLGPTELRKLGMHALLAVSRGSETAPRVVHLTYRPPTARGGRKRPRVLLVGKGVTFDSGGLNLKPADGMLTMKADMGGSATVLATMTVLRDMGCRAEVHAYLGFVENMTGGDAYKPGDILDTWAGKTVEVGNTDAEGRLVLCDLLAQGTASLKPTHVVDVATLTGACVVALGLRAIGLFGRGDALRDRLLEAAGAAGEKMWPMPLYDDYLQQLQKGPADLRNVGPRWGGAITAALFLGEFVPRELAWAHMDIAGPAFTEEDLPEAAVGGTGAGVLTLLRWLERI